MNPEIKKLLREIGSQKHLIIVVGITGVIYSVTYSRLALLLKDLMDNLSKGDANSIKSVIGIALALSLIANISKYFHLYKMNYLAEMVGQSLRNKLEEKFTRLSLSFHNSYSTGPGGLISRVLADVRTIIDGLRMVADIFLHPLLFLLLLGNLIYLDWQLTLIAFASLPFIIILLKSIAKSVRKYSPLGFQQLEGMTSVIKETLDGIRIIQSFNLGKIISKKFRDLGEEFTDSRRMMHSRGELAGPLAELIATMIFMLVIFYITQKVASGQATTGSFLAYTTSILMLNPSLKRAQETYVRIQEVIVAAGRVYQIIEAPHEVYESEKNLPFPASWKKIRFQNISLQFGDKKVLENISFEVSRGEAVAFVGESGSGKSSLLNLLLRFYEPTSGQILVDDEPLRSFNLLELRKNIALVSQDVFLFNDTIAANIQSGNLARSAAEIESVARLANAHDFISKIPKGYESIVGDRGGLLSGGEKQRVSIARALFKDSPILILDEATSALDSTNEAEVQKGLDTLMKGRTTFVVAHRLSTIQNVDRVYVIKQGRAVEIGSHQELVEKKGEYYKFYLLQGGSFS